MKKLLSLILLFISIIINAQPSGPITPLDVARKLHPTAVKTTSYSALIQDFVPIDLSSGSFTLQLPVTTTEGAQVAYKIVTITGTNSVLIKAGGSDVFNKTAGSTTLSIILNNQSSILQYKASTGIWYVLSDNLALSTLDTRYATSTGYVPYSGATSSVNLGTYAISTPSVYGVTSNSVLNIFSNANGSGTINIGSGTGTIISNDYSVYNKGIVTPGICNYNRNFFNNWDAQIAKIQQVTANTTLSIVYAGDSWVTGGFGLLAQPMAYYLKSKYGDAGIGYFGAQVANSSSSRFGTSQFGGAQKIITASWSTTPTYSGGYINSVALAADSSGTLNDSISYIGTATDFVIHYMKKTSGGSFVTRIDGANSVTVSTSGTKGLNFSSITGLSNTQHTLTIRTRTVGTGVLICGTEININQNGIRLHNIGASGSSSTNWVAQDSINWKAGITQLNPSIFMITLGTNDRTQNLTPAQYIVNITRMVNRVLSAIPSCNILLFYPGDNGTAAIYSVSQYVTAAKAYALANNYAFIDNYSLLGSYSVANANGLYVNTLHVNATGANVMNNNFFNYLNNGQDMNGATNSFNYPVTIGAASPPTYTCDVIGNLRATGAASIGGQLSVGGSTVPMITYGSFQALQGTSRAILGETFGGGYAALWLFGGNAQIQSSSNSVLASDGASSFINTPSGGGTLFMRVGGTDVCRVTSTGITSLGNSTVVGTFSCASTATVTGAMKVTGTATIAGNAVATSALAGALLATSLTQAATLDFPSTLAGAVSDLTLTVTGAALNDPVIIGAPNGSVPAAGSFFGWVSAANVVTVRYADNSLVTTYDPASGSFTIKVFKN